MLNDMPSTTENNDDTIIYGLLCRQLAQVYYEQGDDALVMDMYDLSIKHLHDAVLLRPDTRVIRTYVDYLLAYATFLEEILEEQYANINYETALKYLKQLFENNEDPFYCYNIIAVSIKIYNYYKNKGDIQKGNDYYNQAKAMLDRLVLMDSDYALLLQYFDTEEMS